MEPGSQPDVLEDYTIHPFSSEQPLPVQVGCLLPPAGPARPQLRGPASASRALCTALLSALPRRGGAVAASGAAAPAALLQARGAKQLPGEPAEGSPHSAATLAGGPGVAAEPCALGEGRIPGNELEASDGLQPAAADGGHLFSGGHFHAARGGLADGCGEPTFSWLWAAEGVGHVCGPGQQEHSTGQLADARWWFRSF